MYGRMCVPAFVVNFVYLNSSIFSSLILSGEGALGWVGVVCGRNPAA